MNENSWIILGEELNKLQKESTPFEFWHGFIAGIVCSPIDLVPTIWTNFLLDPHGQGPQAAQEEMGEKPVTLALSLYKEMKVLVEGYDESFFSVITGNKAVWAEGFLSAVNFWGEEYLEKGGKELEHLMQTLLIAYDADQFYKDLNMDPDPLTRKEEKERAEGFLSFTVLEIYKLWQEIRAVEHIDVVDRDLMQRVKEDLEKLDND